MEVLQTSNYYIFVKNGKTLWWNRFTSEFSVKDGKLRISANFANLMGGYPPIESYDRNAYDKSYSDNNSVRCEYD